MRRFVSIFGTMLGLPPIDSSGYSWNRRSHDKILLIDGAFEEMAIGFMGGRNVSNAYYGVPQKDAHTYADFEVLVRGVSVRPEDSSSVGTLMTDYFDQVYFHLGNRRVHRTLLGIARGYEKIDGQTAKALKDVEENLGLDRDPEGIRESLLDLGYSFSQVDIVHTIHNLFRTQAHRIVEKRDYRIQVRNAQALLAKVESLIAREQREIVIVSPYLWMSKKQIRLLKAWLRADPTRRLTFITSSMMNNDAVGAQILTDAVLGPEFILDPGVFDAKGRQIRRSVAHQVKLYEFGRLDAVELGGSVEYGHLHGKGLLLRGSGISAIGSFNNDPRSLLLNTEGAMVIADQRIADRMDAEVRMLIQKSHEWGSAEYHQIRNHPNLSATQRLAARYTDRLYRLIIRLNLWWLI